MHAEAQWSGPEPGVVLAKAVLRAAETLGLSNRDLAAVIGCSEATVSRLARGRPLEPDTKPGELALLLLRAFRSLDALVGGDDEAARRWLHAPNARLGGVPADLARTVGGLVHVVEYLDAMRGKV